MQSSDSKHKDTSAPDNDSGESLQIFSFEQEVVNGAVVHRLRLDKANLERVLLHEEVKDIPVVIVSIVGDLRKGKSFLLGFFLKYLEKSEGVWLNKDDKIEGFQWRGGYQRVTSGIHIWSKPFIRRTKNNEKVAVLLMDTQGAFDSRSTVRDCATIFALSNLISSVQIYNIKEQIQENDLQNLEFFTEYGRRFADTMKLNFIKSRLLFLIRDWPYECDFAYGHEGGNAYLKTILQAEPSQPPELQRLRQHLVSCFPNMNCFLLPYPGETVARKKTFKGCVKEINEDFVKLIKHFVPYVLSDDQLVTKAINTTDNIKGEDLITFVGALANEFQNDRTDLMRSAFETTVNFEAHMAKKLSCEFYRNEMDEFCRSHRNNTIPECDVEKQHRKIEQKALEKFRESPRMKIQERESSFEDQLVKKITKIYDEIRQKIRRANYEMYTKKTLFFILQLALKAYENKKAIGVGTALWLIFKLFKR